MLSFHMRRCLTEGRQRVVVCRFTRFEPRASDGPGILPKQQLIVINKSNWPWQLLAVTKHALLSS